MRSSSAFLILSVALASLVASVTPASAMPQFARKYKMACSGCHDALAYPRLNDVGYKFRRAGFRMPENIGDDGKELMPAFAKLGDEKIKALTAYIRAFQK